MVGSVVNYRAHATSKREAEAPQTQVIIVLKKIQPRVYFLCYFRKLDVQIFLSSPEEIFPIYF